ncbi:unnamed protein product [Trypanosoma congolense IL3000]|uniref:Aldehyde dehydrogenase n=1 Tax=Trypanosoma congolense (strain IL3000) TaxID=1068625 RepID=F9WF19_TRYCI|nr:unnamed protein product [Trypanosoma congolense IL3000]
MMSEGILECTPLQEIPNIVSVCRTAYNEGINREVERRKKHLYALLALVEENVDEFCAAIHQDRRRHREETMFMEMAPLRSEVWHFIDHLHEYVKPIAPSVEGAAALDDCEMQYEPLGVVLIIGPWNYPLLLVLQPLVGALAAGNTAVIKPSELAPATAALLARLTPKYIPKEVVGIVNGGVNEATTLLQERFDYILYTGGSRVAEVVMAAAAKHLTPVTLELGGKSPVIVDSLCGSDVNVAAERIMWGKIVNAGQTCIAPDYVLVSKDMASALVEALAEARRKMMGDELLDILKQGKNNTRSDEKQKYLRDCAYPRLVHASHFQRLVKFMEGGKVAVGGEVDEESLTIAPTILTDVQLDHPVMKEEIFGPILPIIPYETLAEVLKIINGGEKPLALYIFSKNKKFISEVERHTSSGAVLVNDVIMHAGAMGLPFGGVGRSGMGAYHGKYSFQTFSHLRPIMRRCFTFSSLDAVRFPPYSRAKSRVLESFLKPSAEVVGTVGRRVWGLATVVRIAEVGYHYARFLLSQNANETTRTTEPR